MAIQRLTDSDWDIIHQVLRACACGPFFRDQRKKRHATYGLVHTLFGIHHKDLKKVADQWPEVDLEDPVVWLAIRGSLLHITFYPHGCMNHWSRSIKVRSDQVDRVADKFIDFYG